MKFYVELGRTPVQIRGVLKLNQYARTVSKILIILRTKKITEIVLHESEGKVMHGCRFSRKKLTSGTFEPLRKGASRTVKEIAFQFDIGEKTIAKFKMQKKREKIYR